MSAIIRRKAAGLRPALCLEVNINRLFEHRLGLDEGEGCLEVGFETILYGEPCKARAFGFRVFNLLLRRSMFSDVIEMHVPMVGVA